MSRLGDTPSNDGSSPKTRWRRGFTLIELSACLLIMAMLVTVAAISLASPYQTVEVKDVIHRIQFWDRLARSHAKQFDEPDGLTFDLKHQQIRLDDQPARRGDRQLGLITNGDTRASDRQSNQWSPPNGYRLAAAISQQDKHEDHELTIHYSRQGWSPTYAIEITTPAGEQTRSDNDHSSKAHWLVIVGLTGQLIKAHNREQVHAIFHSLVPAQGLPNIYFEPAGHDAH